MKEWKCSKEEAMTILDAWYKERGEVKEWLKMV